MPSVVRTSVVDMTSPATPPVPSPHGFALDAMQEAVLRLAVDASGVVAGAPGTGKTTILIARISALLRAGCAPEELAVLTPTRPAATALRDRLALAAGVATEGALARSIAAVAYQIVRAHAVHRGDPAPQLLTGPDEDLLLADLLEGDAQDEHDHGSDSGRWPASLPAAVRAQSGFRSEVRAFLAECTTLGITPDELERRAAAQGREAWHAVASFAREYYRVRARMRPAHRDAAGLVREAVELLRTLPADAPGRMPVARLRAVLVDDAQELTLDGVELLEELRRQGTAVLAFGDPDVSSGVFRGATPLNFARLQGAGGMWILRERYRGTPSQQQLVAALTTRIGAQGIVAHRHAPQAPLDDDTVRVLTVGAPAEEFALIACILRDRHIHHGVAWGNCAVIAHDARFVARLEVELAARDVPTRAGGGARALAASPAVVALVNRILLAARPPEQWSAEDVELVLSDAGMDAVTVRRLRTSLRQRAMSAAEEHEPVPPGTELMRQALVHPEEFAFVDTRENRQAERLARSLSQVRAQIEDGATAQELLWSAWDGSHTERALLQARSGPGAAAADRELDAVVALFQTAQRHAEREDGTPPLTFLRGVLESEVAEDRFEGGRSGAVHILTPAAALGSEYDTVIVAGVQEGVWPNLRPRGSLLDVAALGRDVDGAASDERRVVMHDELRLFVRACSRARRALAITAVSDESAAPSVLFDLLPPALPVSPGHPLTLRGLVARHRRTLTDGGTEAERRHAAQQLRLLADADIPGASPQEWYGIAATTTDAPLYDLAHGRVRVSPSRMQTLEECALDWVIAELGGRDTVTAAGIGTIIHAALAEVGAADEEQLWDAVASRWSQVDFAASWLEDAERRRARDLVRRLALYLRRFESEGGRLLGAETAFDVDIPIPGATHPAALVGFIDRIEQDAAGRVTIVDVKTGGYEPQTDAAVATNPQLGAYQLAFALDVLEDARGAPPGGAKLLVLQPSATRKDYAEPRQPPFDEQAREQFAERVREAVRTMTARTFLAPFEDHCQNERTRGLCRIHTIPAVSAP